MVFIRGTIKTGEIITMKSIFLKLPENYQALPAPELHRLKMDMQEALSDITIELAIDQCRLKPLPITSGFGSDNWRYALESDRAICRHSIVALSIVLDELPIRWENLNL
jgi:hypothetical protein